MMLPVVDKDDNIIGYEEREKCHEVAGILHRGFTILISNGRKVLIQKRSVSKKLWPLYWETSCSGHPGGDEGYIEAATRRLQEEVGFSCDLVLIDKFEYRCSFDQIGTEYEICAVLTGRYDGEIRINDREVCEYRWIDMDELGVFIRNNPEEYAPWLYPALSSFMRSR